MSWSVLKLFRIFEVDYFIILIKCINYYKYKVCIYWTKTLHSLLLINKLYQQQRYFSTRAVVVFKSV